MRGPFFHKLALVEKFKEIFWSSNFNPFFSRALQPSGKSYCFETHFTFQSGNCTYFYQILGLYLYWFSDRKSFKIALNFSRCSKLFAPTVSQPNEHFQAPIFHNSSPALLSKLLTSLENLFILSYTHHFIPFLSPVTLIYQYFVLTCAQFAN